MDESAYRSAEQRLWVDAGATPVERFIRLPRLGVRVRTLEVGDGPPVLFLHGGPDAGSSWAPLAARLADARCIVLDRPGTGLSERHPIRRATFREFCATLVVDVLDALEIERADLIGSSTGSDIAILAALAHPARVGRTVHFGCPGSAPDIDVPFAWRVFSLPVLWRLMAAMPASDTSMRRTMRDLGHGTSLDAGRFPQSILDWSVALARHTPTMRNEMAGSAELVTLRSPGIHRSLLLTYEELARVTSPTLFVWGQSDTFGGPEVGRRMVDAMPDAAIQVLPDGGHLVWLDDIGRAASLASTHLRQPITTPGIQAGR